MSYRGKVYKLNRIYKIWNFFNRKIFKRDHEKIIISDNKMIVGSSNIGNDYVGSHLGNFIF